MDLNNVYYQSMVGGGYQVQENCNNSPDLCKDKNQYEKNIMYAHTMVFRNA